MNSVKNEQINLLHRVELTAGKSKFTDRKYLNLQSTATLAA